MSNLEFYQDAVLTEEILRVQKSLQKNGYARTSDVALGIPSDQHRYFDNRFFTDHVLGRELTELSSLLPHRMRARDVIEYQRNSDGLVLNEYSIITLRAIAAANIPPREYKRVYVLEDPQFASWINILLAMVPQSEQQVHSTMSFDFLRTFQQATAFRHQDHEQFVIIYVVARETEGAITSLHPIEDPEKTLVAITVQPGEYLIFRDSDFMHDITPLEPRFEGDKQYRDAIITLVHYANTYLNADQ